MPEATVMVKDVKQQSGTSAKGRAWTITRLVDANETEYGTFDAKLGTALYSLKGKKADITWDVKDDKNNLTSAVEHVEKPKAGGYDDPKRQRHIAIQNAMYHATAIVLANSEADAIQVNEIVRRVKVVASDLAFWGQEWAERVDTEVPFESADDVPFAPELPDVG